MTRHEYTHTGKKAFKCKFCEKRFADKSQLVRHEQTHTVEKLFKCKLYEKCFSENGDLTRHKRTHTGEILSNVNYVRNVSHIE